MEAVHIDTLPTTKSLLKTIVPETTDILKEKDDMFCVDEIDEDDEIRLRLSDDDENEQDSSSGQPENQQTNSHASKNDLEFDVCIAVPSEEITESLSEQSLIKSDFSETETTNSVKKDQTYINGLNENIADEICNLKEELIMSESEKIPQIMQNSSKYWHSDFDNKWKLNQSHRSFSHRESNDWYKQQYSETEKFNKTHFNNHDYHFNKMPNNIQENYKEVISQPKLSSIEEFKKSENAIDSSLLKNITSSVIDTKEINNSLKEDNISEDLQCEKINSVQDDELITEKTEPSTMEINGIQADSDKKVNEFITEELDLCADKICKENTVKDNVDILENKEINNKNEITDPKENDNDSSPIEDSDVVMTETEEKSESNIEEKSESNIEEKMKENGNECDINEENEKNSNNNFASDVTELNANDIVNSEVHSELQTKNTEVTSHSDDILEDKLENCMEVDNINDSQSTGNDENSNSASNNPISASGNVEENDLDINKIDKIEAQEGENQNIETCINEVEKTSDEITTSISPKLDSIIYSHEKTNETLENQALENESLETEESDDKSSDVNKSDNLYKSSDANKLSDINQSSDLNEKQISEIDESNNNECHQDTNHKSDEIMDVDGDTETSDSLSIAVTEVKDTDSRDLKQTVDREDKDCLQTDLLINTEKDSENEHSDVNKVNEDKKLEDVKFSKAEGNEDQKVSNIIEEVDLVDDESEMETISNSNKTEINADTENSTSEIIKDTLQSDPVSPSEDNKIEESNEDGRAAVHKRRRRKRANDIMSQENNSNDLLGENGVRQKRKSAKNAEEMIRKEILKDDEDDEDSSDDPDKLVAVNYKKVNNITAQPLSPPSLKRTLEDIDPVSDSGTLKKIKASTDDTSVPLPELVEKKEITPKSKESIAETNELVRKISQEDIRGKLKNLKQEELEALLLQKIVECITIRGEMGKLREQARVSKRNQEATRAKCQQLQKQVEGFDMVLKRISFDKSSNNDKFVTPIKINRSVGLQVNFVTDHGIHNLKQIQALKASVSNSANSNTNIVKSISSMPGVNTVQDNRLINQSPRKILKTRSPRRSEMPTLLQVSANSAGLLSTNSGSITPAALVMGKAMDPNSKRAIALQNQNNIVQLVPSGQHQTVVNANVGSAAVRAPNMIVQRQTNSIVNKASDLIDLTDEEDKSKSPVIAPITAGITTRYSRVIQAVPASVALSNSSNLRLVQAGSQGAPATIVNNMNRLAYVMQSGVSGVPTKQLVLTNSNTIRPVTNISARNISTISYKQGVTTLTNGTVRLLTTQAPTTNMQTTRHPAPLPETPLPESNPAWKLPPPAPTLKISKVATGIVLSWTMTLSDKFAEIVSYQLYAYQEVSGTSPNAALWKKVGDVRALPLPMACTLTQFTEGNNYYFAVRAVDIHSRFGQYSKPGNISL